jgi:hypothetical protein
VKLQGAVFLMALFAAGQAIAQQTTNGPPFTTTITVQKTQWHWFAPTETKRTRANLKPVEGLDRRAWTTVVGWHPGRSAFPGAETSEGWDLFWVSF